MKIHALWVLIRNNETVYTKIITKELHNLFQMNLHVNDYAHLLFPVYRANYLNHDLDHDLHRDLD